MTSPMQNCDEKKIVNTSGNSHFINFLADLPFLKTSKAQKIESIKGKSHNFAVFSFYFHFFPPPSLPPSQIKPEN